ncbi:hypothetical protein TcWFU_009367 [Taenia crassiceps]|uniref:Secreted protein n=1 Tax=Taenia crassiceps TaxID=6207 RepID=A0ABR4QBU8_9CEST
MRKAIWNPPLLCHPMSASALLICWSNSNKHCHLRRRAGWARMDGIGVLCHRKHEKAQRLGSGKSEAEKEAWRERMKRTRWPTKISTVFRHKENTCFQSLLAVGCDLAAHENAYNSAGVGTS